MTPTFRDYAYVLLQFALFIAYLFELEALALRLPAPLTYFGLVFGIMGILVALLALLQLNRSLSPFPTPKADGELIQSGLYRYVRHPIYSGIILLTVGYAIFAGSGYKLLVALVLWGLFYFKSNYEETRLLEKYADYAAYRKRTGQLWPRHLGSSSE